MSEETYRSILSIDLEELAKSLRLPEEHLIESVEISPEDQGIWITVRGAAMAPDYFGNRSLYVEPIHDFRDEAAARLDARCPLECGCKRVGYGCGGRNVPGFTYDATLVRHRRITTEEKDRYDG